MIYRAILNILSNDSDFTTAIGTDADSDYKIYPIAPRRESTLPLCVVSIIDQRGNPTKDNASTSGTDEIRIKITVYSDDLDELIDISEKARIAMDAEKPGGTYNTEAIKSIDFESLNDGIVTDYGPIGAMYIEHNYQIWAAP